MKGRVITKRRVLFSILLGAGAAMGYLVLLIFPDAFFAHELRLGQIVLRSDLPIPASARPVLEDAVRRIAGSPLYRESAERRIYVCNRAWRFVLFANSRYKVGGLTYPPLSNNIFLRSAHFDANRLVGHSGKEVPGERTLSYFIAHEITHTMIADRLGSLAYWRLPTWKDEGYCDFIAKASDFQYDDAARRLRHGDPQLDPARSGLYLRYHVLVAFLLTKQDISVSDLLEKEFDSIALEREVINK